MSRSSRQRSICSVMLQRHQQLRHDNDVILSPAGHVMFIYFRDQWRRHTPDLRTSIIDCYATVWETVNVTAANFGCNVSVFKTTFAAWGRRWWALSASTTCELSPKRHRSIWSNKPPSVHTVKTECPSELSLHYATAHRYSDNCYDIRQLWAFWYTRLHVCLRPAIRQRFYHH